METKKNTQIVHTYRWLNGWMAGYAIIAFMNKFYYIEFKRTIGGQNNRKNNRMVPYLRKTTHKLNNIESIEMMWSNRMWSQCVNKNHNIDVELIALTCVGYYDAVWIFIVQINISNLYLHFCPPTQTALTAISDE